MPTGAVVFDMDGVIADTELIHVESWHVLFGRRGWRAPEHFFDQFVGICDIDTVRMINEQLRLDLPTEATVAERLDAFAEIVQARGLQPNPGFDRAHRFLRAHGIPIGVATGSWRRTATVVLNAVARSLGDTRGGEQYFDAIVTRDDVQAAKPDPECYRLACARLNCPPARCVALEDSPSGVRAAVAAGLHCFALATRYYGDEALAQAHGVIRSLDQLVADDLLARAFSI